MSAKNSSDDVLTLDIQEAADYATGGVVSTFRRKFVKTGLVQLVDLGGRSPRILKPQLRDAVLKIAADQIANPGLVKSRSAGSALAAEGRVPNPWGRKGKPREVAVAAAKKAKQS